MVSCFQVGHFFTLRVMGTSVNLKNRFAGQLRHLLMELDMILYLYLWLPRLQHRAGGTQRKQGSPTTAGHRQTKGLDMILKSHQ